MVGLVVNLAPEGAVVADSPSPPGMLLSPLALPPVWSDLDPYQKTITQTDFTDLIHQVYSLDGHFWNYVDIDENRVRVYSDPTHQKLLYTLQFAATREAARPLPQLFRTHAVSSDPHRPLAGLKIALDPGHIGGDWSQMEERFFRLNDDPPIREADLNLRTCKILADLLEADGATVVWTKKDFDPVTDLRPNDLQDQARAWLTELHARSTPADIDYRSKMLFYRIAEIRARAEIIRKEKPDCTVCVHYNADDWHDPNHPVLTKQSRLVIFINGSYENSEIKHDDVKFSLLRNLLMRTALAEEKGCALIGQQLLDLLGYPPEADLGLSYFAHRMTSVPSVYSRNLLANQIFVGPVFYCEGPYMNAQDAYARLQAGDYLGEKVVNGQSVKSVFRLYATGIEQGLLHYFCD